MATADPSTSALLGLLVVAFHHQQGPIVEYVYPPLEDPATTSVLARHITVQARSDATAEYVLEPTWASLPFYALPEGAHNHTHDLSYFHLPTTDPDPATSSDAQPRTTAVFGLSCYRQVNSSHLKVRTSDITRTFVQKAVVLLLAKPVFGFVQDRLAKATELYFGQGDFAQTKVLASCYQQVHQSLRPPIPQECFVTNTALGYCLNLFRLHSLSLLKMLLVGSKVLFVGDQAEQLCRIQYSLISVFPHALATLDHGLYADEDDPMVVTKYIAHTHLQGYLQLFSRATVLEPYFSMTQLPRFEDPTLKACFAGTCNEWVAKHARQHFDAVVELDSGRIQYSHNRHATMAAIAGLTAADRKFMDRIIKSRDHESKLTSEQAFSTDFGLFQSDDYWEDKIRHALQDYVERFLCTYQWTRVHKASRCTMDALVSDYGEAFVTAWVQSRTCAAWLDVVPNTMTPDAQYLGHPGSGSGLLEDTRLRLLQQLDESGITAGLDNSTLRKNLTSAVHTGSTVLRHRGSQTVSSVHGFLSRATSFFQDKRGHG
ncbi:hypothetical protein H4R34_000362 [Dimargaris verticillata]|uniref:UDENN domain-containing protein n=1 Tax=Dimargaris verticillata TaxID=2761393 RepID=A0A9W8BBY0_9FUNG|nr:hypothetical protein H4R34_000362 [Dimargaris verticillata]